MKNKSMDTKILIHHGYSDQYPKYYELHTGTGSRMAIKRHVTRLLSMGYDFAEPIELIGDAWESTEGFRYWDARNPITGEPLEPVGRHLVDKEL